MTSQTENLCAFALATVVVTFLTLSMDSFISKAKESNGIASKQLVVADHGSAKTQSFQDIEALLKSLEGAQ